MKLGTPLSSSALGLPVDVALREPGASAVVYGGLEEAGIAFEASPRPCRCRAATCACSASRNPSPSDG